MATLPTAPPRETFRLSQLIYDTRYRSLTIQVIVLAIAMAVAGWLVMNVVENLKALGKPFTYGFLNVRAGYDINPVLVQYTNDSTHGRALLIGLLNTLLVSFLGCIFATIIGVFVGVLRLSKNWLVARLMTVYIEIFRNVPVLLWILLASVLLSETTASPRDFRVTDEMVAAGQEPKARMWLWDSVALTNRGLEIPDPKFCVGKTIEECDATRPEGGLGELDLGIFKVSLNLLALIAVIWASVYANRRLKAHATATQEATGVRPVTWWKSILILVVPAVALLWALGFHLTKPQLAGFNFTGGIQVTHAFTALLVALSLYTGAFIAEAVRGGVQAISKGQTEAAYALGLQPGQTMRLVVLPQALRVIIPPLISQYLNLTKNSTLGIAVSYMDLRGTLGGITLNQTGREMESMVLMMGIYLALSLIISFFMNRYNARVMLRER